MKLILLGTGADECIPAFGCACPTCTYSRSNSGRNIRQNSSMLIDDGLDSILFDMPPQTMAQLRANAVLENDIRTILFTHRHDDHTAGARYLFQRRHEKGFQDLNRISVYMNESTLKYFKQKFVKHDKQGSEFMDMRVLHSYEQFSVHSLRITALETNHLKMKGSSEECFGYLIESDGGVRFAYLLDAGSDIPERTKEILRNVHLDLLITDCTFSHSDNPGHMDINRLNSLRESINPKRTIISHIGHTNKSHDALVEHFRGTGVDVGYDGITINL